MNSVTTNKVKVNARGLNNLSQSNLHVKILSIIADRMKPESENLVLDKLACNTCTNRSTSPSLHSTKRTSLAVTRARDIVCKTNETICQEIQEKTVKNKPRQSIQPCKTKQIILKRRRVLAIVSKVITYSIDSTKIGNFTIDLRRQMPTQFINSKMLQKLRLQNIQKQQRIYQLQKQSFELQQKIVQLSLNVQLKQKQYSLASIPYSMDKISLIPMENDSFKESKVWIFNKQLQFQNAINVLDFNQKNIHEESCESLIRILRTQALELERNTYSAASKRQRKFSKLI